MRDQIRRCRRPVFASIGLCLVLQPSSIQRRPTERAARTGRAVYASASKLVVTVIVLDRAGQKIATGSGVILSPDGNVATNYHVVAGGTFFEVKLLGASDDAGSLPARPVACSEESDLAMLATTPNRRLVGARIAKSHPVVGDRVFAIGSPYGLEGTLSEGVVSQFRELHGRPLIQTTAQISPGSSGGGLFLESGELVGITEMTLEGGRSLNFAVHADALSSLKPCSQFPAVSSTVIMKPEATPSSTDCLARLSFEYINSYSGECRECLRVKGVIKNKGCGPADGVRLLIEVFESDTRRYVISRTFVLSATPFATGELLDFDEGLEVPKGSCAKKCSIEYTVRDLSNPYR